MRTGCDYLASLKDSRQVYVDGVAVDDVTTHPGFAPIASVIAGLFDTAADPASDMTCVDPATGRTVNRLFTAPRSARDLTAFREAATVWARRSHGWVGRSPDHVGAFLSAFAAHPEAFASGTRDFGAHVAAYRRRVAEESLHVSYAIIPPQVSRADSGQAWAGDLVQVGIVDERDDGIVVRGAQMLATGGAVADEILVSCIKPLGPEDTDFAVSFAVPVGAPGLRLLCRRPYAPGASSVYDYPLTSRFDETDALLVFDDVFIPWERVFVHRDIAGLRRQFFDTGAHLFGNWQAQIRFTVKLQFLAGLARKIAAVNGVDRFPGVVEKLGELASLVSLVESAVLAAEYTAAPDEQGLWRPGVRAVYGAMGLQSELYPRVLAILRDLAGGGVLQVPAGVGDMTSPRTRPDIDRCLSTPTASAEDRVKLFKLVWDAVGSEFAGRHHQYELFYAGAPFVVRGYAFRNYGFDAHVADVETFLAGYGVGSEA
ncbi:4-hydroxyphenylacetate 3-hydroxylase family protein [Streptomyces sp. DT24]|uniref:4-hydroxyphenylacetate 3-hydroxylase family protein n=1 Tax=unclassified Streptomyces TaxID=2593676 RepID=UPI0023BA1D11|nr:4-hydroxyphenylacetate 3-hydroxylase N-terminal domain-containing protein [Streptomyces sp. AM 4-1-1]WEH36902.1 4-hydroxyphenylacetate 3-hydroxylase N-terminal domain-containing protein [Streptomyces sp. AM 4-1-1]